MEPLVAANRELTLVGYWLGPNDLEWPDVRNSVDPGWDVGERQIVIAHLRKGAQFRGFMGLSLCRFCCDGNGASEESDGTYYWPEGLTHYLERHAVRLPKRFVEHVLQGRKVRPRVGRRDLKAAALSETWWRGQTWQRNPVSFSKDDHAMVLLEIVRQQLAWARRAGYADDIENGVAERVGKSGELLLQAVKEAQREHEARYGPEARPFQRSPT